MKIHKKNIEERQRKIKKERRNKEGGKEARKENRENTDM